MDLVKTLENQLTVIWLSFQETTTKEDLMAMETGTTIQMVEAMGTILEMTINPVDKAEITLVGNFLKSSIRACSYWGGIFKDSSSSPTLSLNHTTNHKILVLLNF